MAEEAGDLGVEIRRLRKAAGLSQAVLAATCGKSPGYITQLETGESRFRAASDFAAKLSAALGVPLSHWAPFTSDGHLFEQPKPGPVRIRRERFRIPLVGATAAGKPIDVGGEPGEYLEVDEFWPAEAVALRVRGSSMREHLIGDGDYVVIREVEDEADVGQKVVAWWQDEGLTLKVLGPNRHLRIGRELVPLKKGDRISGVLIGVIRRVI